MPEKTFVNIHVTKLFNVLKVRSYFCHKDQSVSGAYGNDRFTVGTDEPQNETLPTKFISFNVIAR